MVALVAVILYLYIAIGERWYLHGCNTNIGDLQVNGNIGDLQVNGSINRCNTILVHLHTSNMYVRNTIGEILLENSGSLDGCNTIEKSN